MKDYGLLLERYRRQPLPMRLGNLASNMARIGTMVLDGRTAADGASVVEESRHFAEALITEETPLNGELIRLRDDLDAWLEAWPRLLESGTGFGEVADAAARWSNLLLEGSGLAKRS